MTTETMTIHEALAELKMLDKRIKQKIEESSFAAAYRHTCTKISGLTIEEYVDKAGEVYQSITDLIARRAAIRNALSLSNAQTKITVGDKTYTIAEAIEMKKTGVLHLIDLMHTLSDAYNTAKNTVNRATTMIDENADKYIIGLMGSREKAASSEAMALRQAYIDANSYDIAMLPHLPEIIEKLNKEINEFETTIDAKISISNALTTITIEY